MHKVALITGGSRGIGKGIALELASVGYALLINYRENAEAALKTAEQCRTAPGSTGRCEVFQADISVTEDRARLLEFARAQFGRIDLLVNNAGVAPDVRADLLETSEASMDRLFNINVKGPFFLTQATAKWMIELKNSLGLEVVYRPKIVTITSISAYTASVNRGDYCISKAALAMLTPLFAERLAEHGIHTYEIRPGIISTDMTEGVKGKYDALIAQGLTPIKRWGTPEDVGKAVRAIALDHLPFSTGEVINVDGGFHLRRL